ncbi:hypothetical protein ACKTEK_13260 [Tepidamorphus sp. 3E244]|uniref:hypothetical protein n=1 Tax=Tepidamorphus sp. 3E244 TaxID=3385498 RepID=UPI0038FD005F
MPISPEDIPKRCHRNRYYLSAHGSGMTGEYPYLYHRCDFPAAGYDGVIQPGMTLCIEIHIARRADTKARSWSSGCWSPTREPGFRPTFLSSAICSKSLGPMPREGKSPIERETLQKIDVSVK